MTPPPTSDNRERAVLLALGLSAVALVLLAVHAGQADEDAAMLMRYAVNFADGHGVAYNASDRPVDGATDLLVVPLAAGPIAAGLGAEATFALLGGLAIVASVILLYRFARRCGCSRLVALAPPLFVLTGRLLAYLHFGYATPLFGLAILVLWALVERARAEGLEARRTYAVVAAGFVAGLVRPEGFAFLALALVSLAISGPAGRRRSLVRPLVAAGVGGAALLVARWAYFGYPLPNPYYVKGNGSLYPLSLRYAVGWTLVLAWPAVAVLGVAVLVRATRLLALAQVVPLVLVTGMWLLLSNATNRDGRFQYGGSVLAFVGAIVVWPRLVEALATGVPAVRHAPLRWGLAVVAGLGLTGQVAGLGPIFRSPAATPQVVLAEGLEGFGPEGRVLVTSEAGILPLRSGWRTVDAFGLNDSGIAHSGGIDAARLVLEHPDLIVVHGNARTTGGWGPMVHELRTYAAAHRYLVAAPRAGTDEYLREQEWSVYVRRDAPDAARLVASLRAALDAESF